MATVPEMFPQRIVSFLPSATETIYSLGAGDRLVGVTHECDFPPEAGAKPIVVRASLPLASMTSGEVDVAVSGALAAGGSLYAVDENQLSALRPDLIVTQELCQVCAPSGTQITQALRQLSAPPQILTLTPHSLDEVRDNVRELGAAIGCAERAEEVIGDGQRRLEAVPGRTSGLVRPRVFCMEWTDPIYCSGHWVPEMVELAGGFDRIARPARDSVRVPWMEVIDFAPEVLVIMPCGFSLRDAIVQAALLPSLPGWGALPAVRERWVFVVDANSYFARPGPRLVDGVELLAHLIHPDHFSWGGAVDAFKTLL